MEDPLELAICVDGVDHQVALTMRTPGDDEALLAGFLFSEGVIEQGQLHGFRHTPQRCTALIKEGTPVDLSALQRNVTTNSSCGICGRPDASSLRPAKPVTADWGVPPEILMRTAESLDQAQAGFKVTGGLHAAALWDVSGQLLMLREDVGRHNAVDKLLGHLILNHALPISQAWLMVSARASYELVQKAVLAGIPVMAAFGAPSSLAIETAEHGRLTLVGFLSPRSFNVYTHPKRLHVDGFK